MNNKKTGFVIFFIYLIINLIILKDYGLSWDYHYHYYAGLYHLGRKVPQVSEPNDISFSLPDPRLTVEDPFGPLIQIVPSLSQVIFTEKLNVLPPDISYNLPMVIFGSLGILVFYFFLYEAFNFQIALISSVFLALNPSFFGYLHNNMKDIPNIFSFTLAIWLFWRLVKYKNLKSLLLASLGFALAFDVKINSVFIPVICGLYYFISYRRKLFHRNNIVILSYFIMAPIFALSLWWPFWKDPLGKLIELPKFYSFNTINMPVLIFGKIYKSGINIPLYYPYLYLAITTPLPIFILSVHGFIIAIFNSIKKQKNFVLLILWFFIPLLRYLSPKTGAIDGVRHFMEVLAPLSAFAGISFWLMNNYIKKMLPRISPFPLTSLFFMLVLSVNIVKFHPYQTSFFNSFVGGIRGAQGKFDIDFWGTPQKEAVLWLNNNAPENSSVYIVMAQSTAATYLRPDLRNFVNKKSIAESDYLILLNRQSFFNIYNISPEILSRNYSLVYARYIDGVPLVWLFKVKSES